MQVTIPVMNLAEYRVIGDFVQTLTHARQLADTGRVVQIQMQIVDQTPAAQAPVETQSAIDTALAPRTAPETVDAYAQVEEPAPARIPTCVVCGNPAPCVEHDTVEMPVQIAGAGREVSDVELANAVRAAVAAVGVPKVAGVLQQFGVQKASQLPADQRSAFVDALSGAV